MTSAISGSAALVCCAGEKATQHNPTGTNGGSLLEPGWNQAGTLALAVAADFFCFF
jgi:hypothetical protein